MAAFAFKVSWLLEKKYECQYYAYSNQVYLLPIVVVARKSATLGSQLLSIGLGFRHNTCC